MYLRKSGESKSTRIGDVGDATVFGFRGMLYEVSDFSRR